MKPLRILHTDFHRGWGGQASRVLMLSRELARRGHHVTIASPPGELARRGREAAAALEGRLQIEDRFSFRAPGRLPGFLRDIGRMKSLLRSGEFDLVDVHGSQDTWVAALTRSMTGLPRCLVMTRHNTKRVRTGYANRILYGRLIDHLIIVDESVKDRYASFMADGTVDPSRISVIPSAYRADLFHDAVDGTRVRRELGLPPGARVAGVAGRLVIDKGHIHLLRAAALLRQEVPDLCLVFAGQGPNEESLRAQVGELGLEGRVRFLGFRSDIAEVEAGFDVAVLPSVGCDASSASIKEAMALGIPVIASDIGGARNIIDDGVTGLVVEPGSPEALAGALRAIFRDPESARHRARKAAEEVRQRFSIDRLTEETLKGYATALADGERRRGLQQERGAVHAGKPV